MSSRSSNFSSAIFSYFFCQRWTILSDARRSEGSGTTFSSHVTSMLESCDQHVSHVATLPPMQQQCVSSKWLT